MRFYVCSVHVGSLDKHAEATHVSQDRGVLMASKREYRLDITFDGESARILNNFGTIMR